MSIAVLSLLMCLSATPAIDTVVVCPTELRDALQPWLTHRRQQGHQIEVLSNLQTAAELREALRRRAAEGSLRFVLLVGDAEPRAAFDESARARSVATHLATARVNVRFGSEPDIATDNWYADLDGDELPDLAVGRLTADSPDELSVMVRKIIEYEQNPPLGDWRRRLHFVAGVGGFGGVIDGVIESAAKKLLTDGVPAAYQTTMTYGSWQSPFCPDPRRFHDETLARLNEGALCWVYMGHGRRRALDSVRVPGAAFRIFDSDDVPNLQRYEGPPVAIFLACYTAAFDGPADCLGEDLLRSPHGPVAVLGGSRVTMPYAMAALGNELLRELFESRRETLGEVVRQAKLRMAAPVDRDDPDGDPNRRLLDSVAAVMSPSRELLDAERHEHVLLFNLLGDPLLRLPRPQHVTLTAVEEATAGGRVVVAGQSPLNGRCTLELVCRRDRSRFRPRARRHFNATPDALEAYSLVYAQANDRCWSTDTFACSAGRFERELAIPADARGPCHVRVFIEQEGEHALGSTDIYIRQPPAVE